MPSATRLTVGIMGLVAEEERRLVGTRIKEALPQPRRTARGWATIVATVQLRTHLVMLLQS